MITLTREQRLKTRTGPRGDLFQCIDRLNLVQAGYVLLKAALEIGSLVFVNDVALGQLVQHAVRLWKKLFSLFLHSGSAKIPHDITCSLVLVAIADIAGLALADTLDGRLVIGHVPFLDRGGKYSVILRMHKPWVKKTRP